MKNFHCSHCDNLVFFENVDCVGCDRTLGFIPQYLRMETFEPAGEALWRAPDGALFRQCANYAVERVCNWMVATGDDNPYCVACRLNATVPDMRVEGNRQAWFQLESAKRRLIYTLLALRLPVAPKAVDPQRGLSFSFLASVEGQPVLTGHDGGHIVINLAEADDVARERLRQQLREPYRTLLGHFRHEIGHYYWDRLVAGSAFIEPFRALFGDERADYQQALERHYRQGAPKDWRASFISEYATMHPWEDWAETWAHFLHMTDTLETAKAVGLVLQPKHPEEPSVELHADRRKGAIARSFDEMRDQWLPLTYALNSLTRSMGLRDAYPFVLSAPALDKLRFVHEVIAHESLPGAAAG